jgi:DNA-binding beta-propeller fold protein YncE
MVKVFDEKKLIDRDKVVGKPEPAPGTVLKFPAKIVAQAESHRLFIADTNNNRILVSNADGKVTDVIGSGAVGLKDGSFSVASFHMPQGIAASGETLYIADCENHAIRKIDLKAKTVETIAGTGQQVHVKAGGPAKSTPLNSPWDLTLSADGKLLYIAMAGDHRIWVMDLAASNIDILAGNGHEDIVDGPFADSAYAQPSGLALHGTTLFVADSEASAIRALDLEKKNASTVVGFPNLKEGRLFAFGDVDGALGTAKLQHALGVVYVDGKLYIADTYNHKIKIVEPAKKTVVSFLGDGKPGTGEKSAPRFYEPGGLTYLDGKLYVADTDNHRICVIDLKTKEMIPLPLKLP